MRGAAAGEPQLSERLRDGVRVGADVGRKRHHRIAGALADAADAGGGIAFEDSAVFGEGQKLCRIFGGLPIRIVGATLHVVDLLAIELERNAELDERFDLALSGKDSVSRRRDIAQMPGADGGGGDAAWTLHVDDAPACEVAFDGARRFLLDLRPGSVGYRGKVAAKVIPEL